MHHNMCGGSFQEDWTFNLSTSFIKEQILVYHKKKPTSEAKFGSLLEPLFHKKIKSSQRFSGVKIMVFNTTFNKISATGISWRSDLLVEETRVLDDNHRPVTSH